MGWSRGYDETWHRDVGYSVPAFCDAPGCSEVIDRGLSYVCGSEPFGGEQGCGLYFCEAHQYCAHKQSPLKAEFGDTDRRTIWLCSRCSNQMEPYDAKPDHPLWVITKFAQQEKFNAVCTDAVARQNFLATLKAAADAWAVVPDISAAQMCQGLVSSILAVLDGEVFDGMGQVQLVLWATETTPFVLNEELGESMQRDFEKLFEKETKDE